MLFKSVLLATLASLALAAPGGEYDHGDYNWGKDKCYVKHVTYYKTEVAYKTKTDYEYKTKTKSWEASYVTKVPTYIEKTITETKYKTDVDKYPVTKTESYPYTKSEVKDEKVCKTKW